MSDIDYTEPAILPEAPDQAHMRVEWHVRMARAANAELTETKAMFDREIDRLVDLRRERVDILKNQVAWHEAPVKSYHQMRIEEDPVKATLIFPHGKSKIITPKKAKVELAADDDGSGLMAWMLEQHADQLSAPNITTLRSLVTVVELDDKPVVIDKATGEVVVGLVAVVRKPTYTLTLEEGAPIE